MPNWCEFSWAVFLYGAIGGDRHYQALMQNVSFLSRLRSNPATVSDDDIREHLFKGYLNPWKTRVKNSPQSATAIKLSIARVTPLLMALSGLSIGSVNFTQQLTINNGQIAASQAVESCYRILRATGHKIGPTATAKILHILDPELFVMWDNPILRHFSRNNQIGDSPQGYCAFLQQMKQTAVSVQSSFTTAELNPARSPGDSPEAYLSRQMNYNPVKTVAKFIDEYYWVTVTNRVAVPPRWHP